MHTTSKLEAVHRGQRSFSVFALQEAFGISASPSTRSSHRYSNRYCFLPSLFTPYSQLL
jgi:hypothetical protein